jgi:hypothetical protein
VKKEKEGEKRKERKKRNGSLFLGYPRGITKEPLNLLYPTSPWTALKLSKWKTIQ